MAYNATGNNDYILSDIYHYLIYDFLEQLKHSCSYIKDLLKQFKVNINGYENYSRSAKYEYFTLCLLTLDEYIKYQDITNLQIESTWWLLTANGYTGVNVALAIDNLGRIRNKKISIYELGVRPVCVFDRLRIPE